MNLENALNRLQKELAAHPTLTRREWYRIVYLQSDHWKALSAAARNHHGKQCAKCPRTKRLDVHHLNYRNIYDVTVDDLQVLCRPCHKREHGEILPTVWVTTVFKPNLKKKAKKKKFGGFFTSPPAHGGKMVSKTQMRHAKMRREAARSL